MPYADPKARYESWRTLRQRRLADGQCIRCGKSPHRDGLQTCTACSERVVKSNAKYNAKRSPERKHRAQELMMELRRALFERDTFRDLFHDRQGVLVGEIGRLVREVARLRKDLEDAERELAGG